MIEMTVTVPCCPECKSSDDVCRVRVYTELVDLRTNAVVKSDGVPVWTDEYECRACWTEWNETARNA